MDASRFRVHDRSGVTPPGRHLSKEMPWQYYGKMTDAELSALWQYLRSLPALKQGGVK